MKKNDKISKLSLGTSFGASNKYYLLLADSMLDFFQFSAQLRLFCQSDFAYIGSFAPNEAPENIEFKMSSAIIVQETEIHITLLENKVLIPPYIHLANSQEKKKMHSQPLSLFDEPYFLFGNKKYSLFHSEHHNYAYALLVGVDKKHSINNLIDLFFNNAQFQCVDISDFLDDKIGTKVHQVRLTFLQKLFYEADMKSRDYKALKISKLLRDAEQLPINGKFGDPKINMSSIESMDFYRPLLEKDSSFE